MKYLTKDETQRLYQQIYNDTGIHRKRNIALFEIVKYCALRASEVSILKITDYNKSSKTLYCKRLKGSNSNTIKIVDEHVLKALEDYLEDRLHLETSSPYLFLSQKGSPISRKQMDFLMKSYCQKADIPENKHHMHALRHSRAIELIEHGFDVNDVQYWLGHKNPDNTFKYLSYTSCLQKRLFNELARLEQGEYAERFA